MVPAIYSVSMWIANWIVNLLMSTIIVSIYMLYDKKRLHAQPPGKSFIGSSSPAEAHPEHPPCDPLGMQPAVQQLREPENLSIPRSSVCCASS